MSNYKKLAEMQQSDSTVGSEKKFAESIKTLMQEYVTEKIPYVAGDGTITIAEVNIDKNLATGSYDIPIGEEIISIPLVYRANKIVDPAAMYLVKEKRMVALSKEWYENIKSIYLNSNIESTGTMDAPFIDSGFYKVWDENQTLENTNLVGAPHQADKYALLKSLSLYDKTRVITAAMSDGKKYALLGRDAIGLVARQLVTPEKKEYEYKQSYSVKQGYLIVRDTEFKHIKGKQASIDEALLLGQSAVAVGMEDWDQVLTNETDASFEMVQLDNLIKNSVDTRMVLAGYDGKNVLILKAFEGPVSLTVYSGRQVIGPSTLYEQVDSQYELSKGRLHSVLLYNDTMEWYDKFIDAIKFNKETISFLAALFQSGYMTRKKSQIPTELQKVVESNEFSTTISIYGRGSIPVKSIHVHIERDENDITFRVTNGSDEVGSDTPDIIGVSEGALLAKDGSLWIPGDKSGKYIGKDEVRIITIKEQEMEDVEYNNFIKKVEGWALSPKEFGIRKVEFETLDDDKCDILISSASEDPTDIKLAGLTKKAAKVLVANMWGIDNPEELLKKSKSAYVGRTVKNAAAEEYLRTAPDINSLVETLAGQKALADNVGSKGGITLNIDTVNMNKEGEPEEVVEETVTELPEDTPTVEELWQELINLGVPEDILNQTLTAAEQMGILPEEALIELGTMVEQRVSAGEPIDTVLAEVRQQLQATEAAPQATPEVEAAAQEPLPAAPASDPTMVAAGEQMVDPSVPPMPMPATDAAMAVPPEAAGNQQAYGDMVGASAMTDMVNNAVINHSFVDYIPPLNSAMNSISEMVLKLDINQNTLTQEVGTTVIDEIGENLRTVVKLIGEAILKITRNTQES